MASNLVVELTTHLNSRHLFPTASWLQKFLSTTRPNTPLAALKQTVLFRLLASDITTCLVQTNAFFPRDLLSGTNQSRYVAGPIICQVLDIEDIGQSRWSQVEAIEAKERGETTKGREIIRAIPEESESRPAQTALESKGPFKILLQDAKGLKVYALDLRGTEGFNTSMAMGAKLLLKDFQARRGVLMLEPGSVQILGGKIEALHKAWMEGRKERLISTAQVRRDTGTS